MKYGRRRGIGRVGIGAMIDVSCHGKGFGEVRSGLGAIFCRVEEGGGELESKKLRKGFLPAVGVEIHIFIVEFVVCRRPETVINCA